LEEEITSGLEDPKLEDEVEEKPLSQLEDVLKRKSPPRVDEKVNTHQSSVTSHQSSVMSDQLTAITGDCSLVTGNCSIPQDLVNKLEELEIPLDSAVRKAIASHHLSQAYGAAAHVERTWETIDNPRGVFLYQIKRQPIEKLGPTGRVYTASDFGDVSLDQLKHLYPKTWREAAKHYGIEIPEGEEKIEAKDPEQDRKRKKEIIEKYKQIFPNNWQRLAKALGVDYE
jgi:hypothetical protein